MVECSRTSDSSAEVNQIENLPPPSKLGKPIRGTNPPIVDRVTANHHLQIVGVGVRVVEHHPFPSPFLFALPCE